MDNHTDQAADKTDRDNRSINQGQCERQSSDAARSLSPDMKGIHEPHRSRQENNPRTEELEWMPSTEARCNPKTDWHKRLQSQRGVRRHGRPPTPTRQIDADCGEQEWKQIIVQVALHCVR